MGEPDAPPFFTAESLAAFLVAPDAGEGSPPLADHDGERGPGALVLDLRATSEEDARRVAPRSAIACRSCRRSRSRFRRRRGRLPPETCSRRYAMSDWRRKTRRLRSSRHFEEPRRGARLRTATARGTAEDALRGSRRGVLRVLHAPGGAGLPAGSRPGVRKRRKSSDRARRPDGARPGAPGDPPCPGRKTQRVLPRDAGRTLRGAPARAGRSLDRRGRSLGGGALVLQWR